MKKKISKFVITEMFVFSLFFILPLHILKAQELKTLIVNFKKERYSDKNKSHKEVLGGKIYYSSPSFNMLILTSPIQQWISFESNVMNIYYTKDNFVFRMIFSVPVTMPFFYSFIKSITEDFGMAEMGFKFKDFKKKGNQLLSIWTPPDSRNKIVGEFQLMHENSKLLSLEIRDPKGNVKSRTLFKKHLQYGVHQLPMRIETTTFFGDRVVHEVVTFVNAQFNIPLPEDVKNFKIPENAKIEEVIW